MAEGTVTVLGPDTHIKGEMSFAGSARLLGTFEGKITTKGDLHVAESAACKATLEAARVVVDGTIEGEIVAHERVELNGTAQVRGDLSAAALVVAEGAIFVGHCKVGPEAVAEAHQPKKPVAAVAPAPAPERRPMTTAAPATTVQTRPARPALAGADRIARAATDLQNDPEWQQLASA